MSCTTTTRRIRGELVGPQLCEATGKFRHRDRHNAKKWAKYLRSRRKERLRPYRCASCGGWHLTSMSRPLFRAVGS